MKEFRKGGILEMRDSEKEGFRKGGILEMKDLGKEGFGKGGMQERRIRTRGFSTEGRRKGRTEGCRN